MSKRLICRNCHQELPAGSKFCNFCGLKISGKSRKNTRAKKSRGRKRVNQETLVLVIVLAVILAAAGLIAYSVSGSRNTGGSEPNTSTGGLNPGSQESRMIAEQFYCPCGDCDLRLAECSCDKPRGAVEVKAFIQDLLDQGATTNDVIREVQARYGNKI